MDQPQTPGDLVNHPECDYGKNFVALTEKPTGEGLDESVFSMKLKKAEEALTIAACMLTIDHQRRRFCDGNYEFYFRILRGSVQRGSANFETRSKVSEAVQKAVSAILDAEEACTTDTDRAELVRLKKRLLGNDGDKYGQGENFAEADPKSALKDKIFYLKEKIVAGGVELSNMAAKEKVRRAENAVYFACAVLLLIGEEKQQFRCDLGGGHSKDLIDRMQHRMRALSYPEETIPEKTITDYVEMAEKAIWDAKEACNYEEGDDLSSYAPIDRISFLREKLRCYGVDEYEIAARVNKAEEAIKHACDVCMFTDEDKEMFRYDVGDHDTDYLRGKAIDRLCDSDDDGEQAVYDAFSDVVDACYINERELLFKKPRARGEEHQADAKEEEEDGRSCKKRLRIEA